MANMVKPGWNGWPRRLELNDRASFRLPNTRHLIPDTQRFENHEPHHPHRCPHPARPSQRPGLGRDGLPLQPDRYRSRPPGLPRQPPSRRPLRPSGRRSIRSRHTGHGAASAARSGAFGAKTGRVAYRPRHASRGLRRHGRHAGGGAACGGCCAGWVIPPARCWMAVCRLGDGRACR